MRKIAAAGKIEDKSAIRYIVDGLQVKPDLKNKVVKKVLRYLRKLAFASA